MTGSTELEDEYTWHFPSLDRSGVHGGTFGMVCLAYNAFTIPFSAQFHCEHLAGIRFADKHYLLAFHVLQRTILGSARTRRKQPELHGNMIIEVWGNVL